MHPMRVRTFAKWVGLPAWALALAAGSGAPARAQVRIMGGPLGGGGPGINRNWFVSPGVSLQQAAFNLAVIGQAYANIPPYLLGYNPYGSGPGYGFGPSFSGSYSSPYTGAYGAGSVNPYASLYAGGAPAYGGYASAAGMTAGPTTGYGGAGYGGTANSYGSSYDPTSGLLRGAAEVVSSQGSLVLRLEQANLTREQARQARVATRRKLFDEILYERAHTLSLTERQELAAALRVRRGQGTAPATEVLSATALNDLLLDLKKLHLQKVHGPRIELDQDGLKQINVLGSGAGNLGLLRNEGRLSWPLALRSLKPADAVREVREVLEAEALAAVRQAADGKVSAGVLKDLRGNVAKLRRLLTGNVMRLAPDAYIEAKRFLDHFDDAIKALGHADVGKYFNRTYSAQGETVQDLVDYMTKKGLTFAAAVTGDEAAYRSLHQALAAYSVACHRLTDSAKE
jgi:hypothetical protein